LVLGIAAGEACQRQATPLLQLRAAGVPAHCLENQLDAALRADLGLAGGDACQRLAKPLLQLRAAGVPAHLLEHGIDAHAGKEGHGNSQHPVHEFVIVTGRTRFSTDIFVSTMAMLTLFALLIVLEGAAAFQAAPCGFLSAPWLQRRPASCSALVGSSLLAGKRSARVLKG
jgi:hypothetical protein